MFIYIVDTILIHSQQPRAGYSSSYRHAERGADKKEKKENNYKIQT